ncbi:hypothetical protein Mgra_00008753, partial [Meloidogyne graminicola]
VDYNIGQTFVENKQNIKSEKQILKNKSICLVNSNKEKKNSLIKFSEQKMKIMAYLGQLNEQNYDLKDEYLLFELILLNNCLLKIEPEGIDFEQKNIINTRNGTFYTKILINELIEKFDKLIEEEEKEEEEEEKKILMKKIIFLKLQKVEKIIARARNFSDSNLRIEWLIQLPLNCEIKPIEIIEGISHQCEAKAEGDEDIYHFGQLLQFCINWKQLKTNNNNNSLFNIWPNILFRLTSKDYWNRIYLNGFSSIQLPINPSINYLKIQCWKPSTIFETKLIQLKHLHLGDINSFGYSKNWVLEEFEKAKRQLIAFLYLKIFIFILIKNLFDKEVKKKLKKFFFGILGVI